MDTFTWHLTKEYLIREAWHVQNKGSDDDSNYKQMSHVSIFNE